MGVDLGRAAQNGRLKVICNGLYHRWVCVAIVLIVQMIIW